MMAHWYAGKGEQYKMLQNLAKEIGFYCNPEFVRKIVEREKSTHSVSDAQFEETCRLIELNEQKQIQQSRVKRKKRK